MSSFSAGQIVYLEHQGDRLYGEIIQVVHQRQMLWLRPLLLTLAESRAEPISLHGTADLLWPMHGFQAALDVETLPLLAALHPKQTQNLQEYRPCHQEAAQLRQFIEKAWRGEATG